MQHWRTVDLLRGAWLECAKISIDLVGDERVGARWEDPSCLPDMSVGQVAGHLSHSGVFIVEEALAKTPSPAGTALSASRILSGAPLDADDPKHDDVRIVAASQSANGQTDLVAHLMSSVQRIEPELMMRDDDTIIAFPWGPGVPMTMRELLRSRIVELAVHLDDLAVSVEIDDLTLPEATVILAGEVAVVIDVERYGATEVLRALCRRQRGSLDSLRTF